MEKEDFDSIVDNGVKLFKQLLAENLKEIEDRKKLCPHKNVRYIGEDWTGRVWVSIYECNDCGKELI